MHSNNCGHPEHPRATNASEGRDTPTTFHITGSGIGQITYKHAGRLNEKVLTGRFIHNKRESSRVQGTQLGFVFWINASEQYRKQKPLTIRRGSGQDVFSSIEARCRH